MFHIFSALAEFERDLIRDRTRAGLNAVRKRGEGWTTKFTLSQRSQENDQLLP